MDSSLVVRAKVACISISRERDRVSRVWRLIILIRLEEAMILMGRNWQAVLTFDR